MPLAGCNLSAVLDCKQAKIAVALLEHKVVYLPDLFGGGTEGKSGICEVRFGEVRVNAVCMDVFLSLGGLEVADDGRNREKTTTLLKSGF